jgi:hypothetical protein
VIKIRQFTTGHLTSTLLETGLGANDCKCGTNGLTCLPKQDELYKNALEDIPMLFTFAVPLEDVRELWWYDDLLGAVHLLYKLRHFEVFASAVDKHYY